MSDSILFPTMVIGSLPRPRWILDLVEAREHGRLDEEAFQRALDPAILFAISVQEQAGIDYISDGEWRRQTYISGFSRAVEGFQDDVIEVQLLDGRTRTWPGVVSKLRRVRPIAGDEVRYMKQHASHRIKATMPSPYMIDRWFYDPDASGDAYGSREALIEDAADVLRAELLSLRDLGVDMVQFDDAMIGRFVGDEYNSSGANPKVKITMDDLDREMEMAVAGMNRAVEGIDGITVALHVCRGHRARKHVAHGDFRPIVPYLYQMNVDILALELAAPDAGSVDTFRDFPDDKCLGMGVIDVLSEQVDEPEVVIGRAKQALAFIDKTRLVLNPDCGFAPSSDNPITIDEAYLKLKSIATAARRLREEYA